MTRNIIKYEYGVISRLLAEPYELSFATVKAVDSIWVFMEDGNGCIGIGEAVPLPGYGVETTRSVQDCVAELGRDIASLTDELLREKCLAAKSRNPFAASAVMTALEFSAFASKVKTIVPTPLTYPLSSKSNSEGLLNIISNAIESGYRFFKMKIGNGVERDIESMRRAIKAFPEISYKISFDANQAYSFQEALQFCYALEGERSNRVFFVEEPLKNRDWEGMKKLCGETEVDFMLDESIYNLSDIERAKEIGCKAVKLKLFKHCGLENTLEMARKARGLGLRTIIGNGVSTDIGNLGEALLISSDPDLFLNGAECNGYLKLQRSIIFKDLQNDDKGRLVWRGTGEDLPEQFNRAINCFINSVESTW